MKQKGFVIWLTGLPCSGKTTIAKELRVVLKKYNIESLILDGDELRKSINMDLDFSDQGRSQAVKRASQIAELAAKQDLVVIVSMVSPLAKDRDEAKDLIGSQKFVEVWIDSGLEMAKIRDVKGHYSKAMDGKIQNFTGVSSPYEEPLTPNIRLDTRAVSPEKSVFELLWYLQKKNFVQITWLKK